MTRWLPWDHTRHHRDVGRRHRCLED